MNSEATQKFVFAPKSVELLWSPASPLKKPLFRRPYLDSGRGKFGVWHDRSLAQKTGIRIMPQAVAAERPKPVPKILHAFLAIFICILPFGYFITAAAQVNSSEPAKNVQPVRKAGNGTPRVIADDTKDRGGIDAPVDYDAHIIENDVSAGLVTLIGDAVVKYKSMTIEAGKIVVNFRTRTLVAEPLADTLSAAEDSLLQDGAADSLRVTFTGYPVFVDGGDRLRGERMEYNFDTGQGLVVRGRTDLEGGKYFGERIKRVSGSELHVSRGTYTSCEIEENPHYHFWARRMKIVVNRRVIAKPIVLYLGHVPLAILPFGMFPTETGRRSGLIVPRYGESVREGRYLRELGYYWAISDYFDARTTVDFYEKSGWFFKGGINYALRYNFTGSLSGSLTRKNFSGGLAERRWDVAIRHNQTLGKTASFNVSGRFVSDNSFYKDFSFNRDQRLARQLVSQATFSKRWPKAKNNLTVSFSETKDLENGSVTRLLPGVQFYFGERQIFGGGSQSRTGARPRPRPGQEARPWYENLYFGYNMRMQSKYERRASITDPEVFKSDRLTFANHDVSLSLRSTNKIFGVLGFQQRISFNEDWFDRVKDFEDSTLAESTEKGFFARHTFQYTASANTKIYGLFQPGLGPIKALRHVMTPSISFNYRPDFSASAWGYYTEVLDADSNRVRRDRFGGTPRGKLASMTINVANLFQMKTQSGEKEKKIDLFRLNLSTAYNFAARQKKLSSLRTSLNATPARQLNFSLSMSHSPYVFEQTGEKTGVEIDRYLWQEKSVFKGGFLRLTSLSITSGINLQGKGAGAESTPARRALAEAEEEASLSEGFNRFEGPDTFKDLSIPWRARLTFRYSLFKSNPFNPSKRAYIDISNAEINLSKNWRVRFRGQFDLRSQQLVGQHWTIYRDLHCWEASFTWTPTGRSQGFFFRINIKAPQLRDIKFERHGGRSSIFGGTYY